MIKIVLILALLLLADPVAAGPFEDGLADYEQHDYTGALSLWRPLADHGNTMAQSLIGTMYFMGYGVPKDYEEAMKWYRLAAEQGNSTGQSLLGMMYEMGYGVPKDYVEALKWNRLAAEHGNAAAQSMLGTMYALGHGVPKNEVLAYMWCNLGAAGGFDGAAQCRDMIGAHMTPAAIADAQRLSREWKPK